MRKQMFRDQALRAEFQEEYRRPGWKYIAIACALGGLAAIAFYLIDAIGTGIPWIGGAQSVRLALVATYLPLAVLCWTRLGPLGKHYALMFSVAAIGFLVAACFSTYERHRSEGMADLLWSLERTVVLYMVVVYGFSRLWALPTMAIASCGALAIATVVWLEGATDMAQLARMALHLSIVTVCCCSLRLGIQRREWDLFLLAKENLRRNRYAEQLELAKLAVEDADAAKARFLANMSHEVRTPMNGVLQILEVVGEHVNSEDRALIEKGRRSGQALMRILNGILDYSKLAHGIADLKESPVDLGDVCRTAIELHAASATTKYIELRSRLDLPPTGESWVTTDEVKVFEVVNNLLSNALKFTDSGFVELVVSLRLSDRQGPSGATLSIEVRDSGLGIPAEDVERVFLPFFQRQEGAVRQSGGTGLGLSIVKQLVEVLRGEIRVESSFGHGSAFFVSLPVQVAAFRRLESLRPPPRNFSPVAVSIVDPSTEFRGKRLLLVDDNELNAMLACRLLEAIGFEVVIAENGAVAIDALTRTPFDVVMMDCQMPVMDGYTATRAIRAYETRTSAARTPVIAVTAYTLEGDREKCLASGMDDFLGKPYSLAELRPTLARWVRGHRAGARTQSMSARNARGSATDFSSR